MSVLPITLSVWPILSVCVALYNGKKLIKEVNMALPTQFEGCLSLPVIAAPMFLASNPTMVIENCKAGVIGTFPAAINVPLKVSSNGYLR